MAKGKIWYIGERQGGNNNINYSLKDSLEYIANEEKTEGIWASGVNCLGNWESAYKDMMRTKRKFGKMNKRQAYHMIISFKETENDKQKAWDITGKVLEELFEERFEVFYTMHTNTKHLHAHAIINSVSFKDGKKFRYEKGDWKKKFQPVIDKYALEIGFEKLDMEEDGPKPSLDGANEKINWYKVNKEDIDTAIGEASSHEEFEIIMRKMGYYLDYGNRGGDLCLKIRKAAAGQLYYRRCTEKTLGYAYTQEGIKDRIAAKEKAYPIYPARQVPKAVCIRFHNKGRAKRRFQELSPFEQFELKRFYVYNKRGRANYRINWQVVNLYRRKARESLYQRDLVFKYKIFSYEKFNRAEEDLKLKLSKIEEGTKDLHKKEKLYRKELSSYREIEKLLEAGDITAAELLSRKLEKESGHTIREIRELSQGIKREKEQLKKEARFYRKEYKSILSMHKEYAKANGLPLPEELKDEGDALMQHNRTGEGSRGEEPASDGTYDKNISFAELSSRKGSYAKTAAEAFNKLTSKDYSRAVYYYCCDRKNPCNYIRMKSQTAKDIKGEEYTKTEYAVFRDNVWVENPEKEDGLFTDERVKGWNSRKWTELREKMVGLSGMSGDDLIMFYSEKGFKNYQKVYERDMGERSLEKEQGRK